LSSFSKGSIPEAIKEEAKRLLQLHTPREMSITTKLSGIIALRKTNNDSGSKLAKLVKELLTHAEKAKIDPLRWHTQASQRRSNFHHWVSRIKDVCAMFKETSTIMPKEKIIPYEDKKCIGNRALYQLILSKVDNHTITSFSPISGSFMTSQLRDSLIGSW